MHLDTSVVKEIIMKALDLRKKKKEDLDKELIELRKAQFSTRMQISTQQSIPSIATEDVISMTVNFVAQETTANKGDGGEVTIFAKKA